MKLTIGIATRGRYDLLSTTIKHTRDNIREKDTKLVALFDDDDPTIKYAAVHKEVILSVKPREDSIGAKWNRMISLAPADVYLAMVDHSPQVTPGFDTKILQAAQVFPDGIGCVYSHMANLSFPSYQAPTARMVEIMGGIYPTYFPYWFVDHWLDDICRMTGRYVFADTAVDSSRRPGTQDFRDPPLWAALYDALQSEREYMAEMLLEQMEEPAWKKEQLRMNWPLVHQRSRMINGLVRAMPGTDKSTDARYERIRANGISMIQNALNQLERKAA